MFRAGRRHVTDKSETKKVADMLQYNTIFVYCELTKRSSTGEA